MVTPPALPHPTGVVIATNDDSTPAARTAGALAAALRARGILAMTRDTAFARWATVEVGSSHPGLLDAWGQVATGLLEVLAARDRCDTILGLDLAWLLSPERFLDSPSIRQVVGIWFDDLRTACVRLAANEPRTRSFQDTLRHPKVTHVFYGPRQLREAELLGITNARLGQLAAASPLLRADGPVLHPGRLAFLGGPGATVRPSPRILALLDADADLDALRAAMAEELLGDTVVARWDAREPTVHPWMAASLAAARATPARCALEILHDVAAAFPRALACVDASGELPDAAYLVKLVRAHDRAALVLRLWKRGLVDVYSQPWHWEWYGVRARPLVRFHQLAAAYRAYPVHLNAGYCIREADANERLFEVAAAGRATLNLDSPDVARAFAPDEAPRVSSLAEAEDAARRLLGDADAAAEIGERARARVRREHTWEHRMAALFAPDVGGPA